MSRRVSYMSTSITCLFYKFISDLNEGADGAGATLNYEPFNLLQAGSLPGTLSWVSGGRYRVVD